MDPNAASVLLKAIASGALAIWLLGLVALVWAWQIDQVQADEGEKTFDPDIAEAPPGPRVSGVAEVEGDPEELSVRAAAILARWMVPGALAIEERHNNRVVFSSTGIVPAWGLGTCRRGVLDFKAAGAGRTRVEYNLAVTARRWLLGIGAVVQVLGLAVLILGYWALATYVAPAQNPGLRYQVIQMIQVIHFLWPPFLFAFLYRRVRKAASSQIRGLVHNLPYLDPDSQIPHRFGAPPRPRKPYYGPDA